MNKTTDSADWLTIIFVFMIGMMLFYQFTAPPKSKEAQEIDNRTMDRILGPTPPKSTTYRIEWKE